MPMTTIEVEQRDRHGNGVNDDRKQRTEMEQTDETVQILIRSPLEIPSADRTSVHEQTDGEYRCTRPRCDHENERSEENDERFDAVRSELARIGFGHDSGCQPDASPSDPAEQ